MISRMGPLKLKSLISIHSGGCRSCQKTDQSHFEISLSSTGERFRSSAVALARQFARAILLILCPFGRTILGALRFPDH